MDVTLRPVEPDDLPVLYEHQADPESKAMAAFLGEVPERPLFARVAEHNGGSRRVLEKCGFAVVGRDRWHLDDGTDNGPELILRLD